MTHKHPTYILLALSALVLISCGKKKEETTPSESPAAQTQSVKESHDPLPMDLKDEALIDAEENVYEPFPG